MRESDVKTVQDKFQDPFKVNGTRFSVVVETKFGNEKEKVYVFSVKESRRLRKALKAAERFVQAEGWE